MVPLMSKTLAQLFALTTLAASSALAVPAHAAETAAVEVAFFFPGLNIYSR